MSAPVRIEARAWGDIRFATLARLLGLADADHALIKVARIWSWQTEHFSADNPTYEVDADTIESVLGPGGPAAIVRAKLADETPNGYRIRGTEGQIEWCESLSSKRQQAGEKRAKDAPRDERGRLLPKTRKPDNTESSKSPAPVQHPSSTPPAQSSAPTPDPAPSPEDQKLSPARDPAVPAPHQPPVPTRTPVDVGQPGGGQPRPHETQQGAATTGQGATAQGAASAAGNVAEPQTIPTPDCDGHRTSAGTFPDSSARPSREDRRAVRDEIRGAINAARTRVGAKLGTPLHPCLPFDRGIDSDLSGQLDLAPSLEALEAIARQARHAVAMAEIEATADPERVQFLTGAIFAGGNFARLAAKTAATAALVRTRAPPRGSEARAPDEPRKIKTLT